jgi:hypothetical protein
MHKAALQPGPVEQFDKCTRCLQPVPTGAPRCPGCGQPHQNRRWIPLAIGTAGVFALVFVMLLMYYAAWKSDLSNAEVVPDADGAQPEIMVKTPEEGSKPSPPPPPEKKPPLNDQ